MAHPSRKLRQPGFHAVLALILIGLLTTGVTADTGRLDGPESVRPSPSEPDWRAPHVPGEMLLALPDGAPADFDRVIESAGMQVVRRMPQLRLALVRVPVTPGNLEAEGMALAAERASELGAAWAEPNYLFEPLDFPDDPDFLTRQNLYLSKLGLPAGWAKTTGRPEIVIAVLDTGVSLTHPELQPGIWTNPGEIPANGVDDEGNGFVDDVHGWDFASDDNLPDDDHGHGTHVAGIAAARVNNSIGIAGIAGNATLMPVDVFGGGIGTYADLIEAILYAADNGARVINLSLGAISYSRGEEEAVAYAVRHGALVVAAAGNTNSNAPHYPAAHPDALAVAATDSNSTPEVRAGFSTWGDFVDVAAPGVTVWSTYPGGYRSMSGTSMATPHVTGLAALILSADPTLTPAQVRAIIETSANDLGTNGWDPYFGYGRINVQRALDAVSVQPGPVSPKPPTRLDVWPPGCQEALTNGSFDAGAADWVWHDNAAVGIIDAQPAARFTGGPASYGLMAQALTLPERPVAATLRFLYRIETQDYGKGASPDTPWDDGFTVTLQREDGTILQTLLRTGNTADTSNSGLPWDDYLYLLAAEDVALLRGPGPIRLVFVAQNDGDALPTTFWVDDVRLCVLPGLPVYLPFVAH